MQNALMFFIVVVYIRTSSFMPGSKHLIRNLCARCSRNMKRELRECARKKKSTKCARPRKCAWAAREGKDMPGIEVISVSKITSTKRRKYKHVVYPIIYLIMDLFPMQ